RTCAGSWGCLPVVCPSVLSDGGCGMPSRATAVFFFKQKTAYEIGLGIPAEPLFRSQASTQRRARERSVAIQTLLLVRKSKSSSVKSKTAEAGMSLIEAKAVWKRTDCSVT